jgi:nucleoid-associated protein YgaU
MGMILRRFSARCRPAAVVATVAAVIIAVGCADPKSATQPASQPSAALDGQAGRSTALELAPVPEDGDPGALPGRVHSVERGETLYSIAAKYYGDSRQWRRIMTANRNRVKNERDLPVGMKLIIP